MVYWLPEVNREMRDRVLVGSLPKRQPFVTVLTRRVGVVVEQRGTETEVRFGGDAGTTLMRADLVVEVAG